MFPRTKTLLGSLACAGLLLAGPVFAQGASSAPLVAPKPATELPQSSPYEPPADAPPPEPTVPQRPANPAGRREAGAPIDDYTQGHGPRPSFGPPISQHYYDGLTFSFLLGAAMLKATYSVDGKRVSYSGFGPSFAGALGIVVAPNLILLLDAQAIIIPEPKQEGSESSGRIADHNLGLLSLGPGLAYHMDSPGLLFTGTLALTKMDLHQVGPDNADKDVSELGVGANLRFGKEWWVDLHTGLGAHLQLHLSNAKVHDQGARMTTVALALLLSLTLN